MSNATETIETTKPDAPPPSPSDFWTDLDHLATWAIGRLRRAYEADPEIQKVTARLAKGPAARPVDGEPKPVVKVPAKPAVKGTPVAQAALTLNIGGERVTVPAAGSPLELARAAQSERAVAAAREHARQQQAILSNGNGDSPYDRPRREHPPAQFDADLIARRCRLKARAARWQYERDNLPRDELAAKDAAIIAEARELPDGFLWMCKADACRVRTREAMDLLAGAYETLAEAAELVGSVDADDPDAELPDKETAQLLAEAQSMLHVMLGRTRIGGHPDPDQMAAFVLAREAGKRRQFYLEFLSQADTAEPADHADLRDEIATLRRDRQAHDRKRKGVDKLVGKIRYAAGKLLDAAGDAGEVDADDPQFATVQSALIELVNDHKIAPGDGRLRSELLRLVPRLPAALDPAALDPAARAAFDAVDEYLDRQSPAPDEDDADDDDPLLIKARPLTNGRHVVLIGGQPVEVHRRRIEEKLGLGSLRWVRVEHGESFDAAERELRKAEVSLAIVMTRFRSHRDGPAARLVCKDRGIPLVELPAGFNWRSVAHHVLDQAADRLSPGEAA